MNIKHIIKISTFATYQQPQPLTFTYEIGEEVKKSIHNLRII